MRITDLYFSWWLRPGTVRTLVVGGVFAVFIPETRPDVSEKAPQRRATSRQRRLEGILLVGGKIEVLFDS